MVLFLLIKLRNCIIGYEKDNIYFGFDVYLRVKLIDFVEKFTHKTYCIKFQILILIELLEQDTSNEVKPT